MCLFTHLPAIGPCNSALAQETPMASEAREYARLRMLRAALNQSRRISGYWDPGQRDCAGFVRFLFRQAVGEGPGTVRNSPLWLDRHGEHADFLRADELISYNFSTIQREPQTSRLDRLATGDLLVFHHPSKPTLDAWHLMVVLKSPPGAAERVLLIYHNGATGAEAQLKKVWLDDLLATSATEWQPKQSNPNFLGVYRWKGWIASK